MSLLAQILADPDDDDLRLVYADWLLERGDERGEVIRIGVEATRRDLAPEERARHDALVAANGVRWLGRLGPVLRGPRFERGWAVAGRLEEPRPGDLDLARDAVEWRFVRKLECASVAGHESELVALLASDGLSGLTRLFGLPQDTLTRVLQARAMSRLRVLELRGSSTLMLRWLEDARALPALEELVLAFGDDHTPLKSSWVLATVAGKRLVRLRLRHAGPALGAWQAELERQAPASLREVTLGVDDRELLLLRRGRDGRWSDLTVDAFDGFATVGTRLLRRALETLPPDALTRLAARGPAPAFLTRVADRQRLLARLEDLPGSSPFGA